MVQRVISILFLLLLFIPISYSQFYSQEKRIYLLDVTESMKGLGDGNGISIFEEVKKSLSDAIDEVKNPSTEILVIPFAGKPFLNKAIHGYISDKSSIISQVGSLETMGRMTNISDAWKVGVSALDSTKINYLFLLTDGKHNTGSPKQLYENMQQWNSQMKGEWCFAFYVMLTENAVDEEIRKIADETSQMWKIQSMNVNIGFLRPIDPSAPMCVCSSLSANVLNSDIYDIHFQESKPNLWRTSKSVHVTINPNPYYTLSKTDYHFTAQGTIKLEFQKLKAYDVMPSEYPIALQFSINNNESSFPLIFFTPKEIRIKMINRGARIMTFKLRKEHRKFLWKR